MVDCSAVPKAQHSVYCSALPKEQHSADPKEQHSVDPKAGKVEKKVSWKVDPKAYYSGGMLVDCSVVLKDDYLVDSKVLRAVLRAVCLVVPSAVSKVETMAELSDNLMASECSYLSLHILMIPQRNLSLYARKR